MDITLTVFCQGYCKFTLTKFVYDFFSGVETYRKEIKWGGVQSDFTPACFEDRYDGGYFLIHLTSIQVEGARKEIFPEHFKGGKISCLEALGFGTGEPTFRVVEMCLWDYTEGESWETGNFRKTLNISFPDEPAFPVTNLPYRHVGEVPEVIVFGRNTFSPTYGCLKKVDRRGAVYLRNDGKQNAVFKPDSVLWDMRCDPSHCVFHK